MKSIIREEVLANGIDVIHTRKAGLSPTVLAVVKAGPLYETEDNVGISHFAEHLMLMGTTSEGRDSRDEVYSEISELTGGMANGEDWICYTSVNHIPLGFRVLREETERAMELISDILLRASLETPKIEAEKSIVLDEILRAKDIPQARIWKAFLETAFKIHPLRRSVLGSKESVQGLNPEEVRTFYKKMFAPQALIVVGDIGLKETMKFANRYFKECQAKKGALLDLDDEPENYGENIQETGTNFHQAHLLMGLKMFNVSEIEMERLKIVRGYLKRRLSDRLLNKEPISYERTVLYRQYPCYSFLATHAAFDVQYLARVEEIMKEEFLHLAEGKFDEKMIETEIKTANKAKAFAQEHTLNLACLFMKHYLLGNAQSAQECLSWIEEVALEDLISIIHKHITPCVMNDSLTKVALLP